MARRGKQKKKKRAKSPVRGKTTIRGRMVVLGRPDPDARPSWMVVMMDWETTEREFWAYVVDWREFLGLWAINDKLKNTYWGGAMFLEYL